jgi:hypothetical protein
MAVVFVSTETVKPDRYDDYLTQIRQLKAIVERCGGKNVRLLAGLVAGEATGTMTLIVEADDFGAMGAATDKILIDPEGQAFMASLNNSSYPGTGGHGSYWMDVPL